MKKEDEIKYSVVCLYKEEPPTDYQETIHSFIKSVESNPSRKIMGLKGSKLLLEKDIFFNNPSELQGSNNSFDNLKDKLNTRKKELDWFINDWMFSRFFHLILAQRAGEIVAVYFPFDDYEKMYEIRSVKDYQQAREFVFIDEPPQKNNFPVENIGYQYWLDELNRLCDNATAWLNRENISSINALRIILNNGMDDEKKFETIKEAMRWKTILNPEITIWSKDRKLQAVYSAVSRGERGEFESAMSALQDFSEQDAFSVQNNNNFSNTTSEPIPNQNTSLKTKEQQWLDKLRDLCQTAPSYLEKRKPDLFGALFKGEKEGKRASLQRVQSVLDSSISDEEKIAAIRADKGLDHAQDKKLRAMFNAFKDDDMVAFDEAKQNMMSSSTRNDNSLFGI